MNSRIPEPSEAEQIGKLADDLDKFVHRLRHEYSLSYATVIGILTNKVHVLQHEAITVAAAQREADRREQEGGH